MNSSIDFVNPADLPEDDPRRTTPLHEMGAEYRHVKDPDREAWYKASDSAHFHGFTYNDLYGAWRDFHRWRVPVSK